jgi:cytochrome d ubiquinol oxidase subunit I
MTDFFAVVLNPNIWVQFPHVLASGLTTASFVVLGVSAYHLLRKNEVDVFKRSFQIAAAFGVAFSVLLAINGHSQAQHMVQNQPMKMAAAEALWETESPASFSLFTIGDLSSTREVWSFRLPNLLSLLAYNQLDGEVKGMNALQAEFEAQYGPGNYIPPAVIPYWTFRIMVGAGFAMIGLALYAMFVSLGDMAEKPSWLHKILPWAISLPFIANSAGWILTEVGRYPWAVYGLVKLEDGVSPNVSVGMLWTSLIGYVLIYGLLMFATIYLLRKYALAGPAATDDRQPPADGTPALVGAQD